ncbi:MAG: hypothetical protein KAS53_12515 [Candidatus Cloacimonetes bacterium]|nr:hypothetical protein [Candidatus Cloacimonadota bacterium]
MKKTLSLILLTFFVYSLINSEEVYQKIEITELLENFIPNYEIENRFLIEGIGQAFAVAQESEDILVVTESDSLIKIHLFENSGKLLWEKTLSTSGYNLSCSISNNGSAIIITSNFNERATNYVLDRNGNTLFEKILKDIKLKPTPNGKYFYEEIGIMAGRRRGIYIYNRKGENIQLTGYNFADFEHIRIKFINNEEVFAYMKNQFVFYNFEDGCFTQKWSYSLLKEEYFGIHFKDHALMSPNYIFVSSPIVSKKAPQSKTKVLSYEGKLIFSDDIYYGSASFLTNDRILGYSNTNKGRFLNIIDFNTKQTHKYAESPQFEKNRENNPFNNVLIFDKSTLYSIRRFPWDKYRFSSLIVSSVDNNHYISDYSFIKISNRIIALKQYTKKTELVLLKRK